MPGLGKLVSRAQGQSTKRQTRAALQSSRPRHRSGYIWAGCCSGQTRRRRRRPRRRPPRRTFRRRINRHRFWLLARLAKGPPPLTGCARLQQMGQGRSRNERNCGGLDAKLEHRPFPTITASELRISLHFLQFLPLTLPQLPPKSPYWLPKSAIIRGDI